MCNYHHGGTIECRGDGYMWDADDDGYDPDDLSMPCPACNTKAWLDEARENGESVSYSSGYWCDLSGEDMWLGGVWHALRANPQQAPRLIRQMGIVRPIIDHPTDPSDFIALYYDNRQQRHLVSRNKREGRYLSGRALKGGV